MKNRYLIIILLILFSSYKTISLESKLIPNSTSNEQNIKKHFFDVCGIGGASFYYCKNPGSDISTGYGGLIGTSFGYQYAFTPYFAFGPGVSGFLSIVNYHNKVYVPVEKYMDEVNFYNSGGSLMFTFMFGDLNYKRIAFLFDIGGGWMAAAKLGLYYKGFVFKTGYAITLGGYGHNITCDFGYKFNWAGKQAIAKVPVKETKPVEPVKEEKTVEAAKTEKKIEELKEAKEGEVITFNDIIFYSNVDTIKPESFPVLDRIAKVLTERKDLSIEIGGYTNSTGSPKDELLLSTKRAVKVATYLIEKGIDANRLKTAGYGSLKLKQATIDEANRRVEIKILKVGK